MKERQKRGEKEEEEKKSEKVLDDES